jgi:CheY-like chemotaxis protein
MEKNKNLILSIDDDEDFNKLLGLRLKNIGLRLITTTTPEIFFAKIKSAKPTLCFVDINLGDLYGAGFQIIKALRQKYENKITIIALSKRSSREDIDNALELGADDYIMKPIDMLILEPKLQEFCQLENVKSELPMFLIPKNETDCDFQMKLSTKRINEDGIIFKSPYYISPKSAIHASGGLIFDITKINAPLLLNVIKCELDSTENSYLIETSFDTYNEQLSGSFRDWLINNQ